METKDLIRYFGDKANALSELNISRQLFEYWEKHGIPIGRQALIHIATRGKLKVSRK